MRMVVIMLTMMGLLRREIAESEDIIWVPKFSFCSCGWKKLAIILYIIVPYIIFIRRR